MQLIQNMKHIFMLFSDPSVYLSNPKPSENVFPNSQLSNTSRSSQTSIILSIIIIIIKEVKIKINCDYTQRKKRINTYVLFQMFISASTPWNLTIICILQRSVSSSKQSKTLGNRLSQFSFPFSLNSKEGWKILSSLLTLFIFKATSSNLRARWAPSRRSATLCPRCCYIRTCRFPN